MTRRSRLSLLIDLAHRLRQDEEVSLGERRRRDRGIGAGFAPGIGKPAAQLAAWLDAVSEEGPPGPGARCETAHRLGILLLSLVGLAAGWLAAMAVFFYDGARPVNVVRVLAVFVGLQLVLLLLLGLASLPRGVVRLLPGVRAVQEGLALLSPGRLRGVLLRRAPAEARRWFRERAGDGRSHWVLFGRVEKWAVLLTAQAGAVWFNLGALAGCLYLIVFSDLAFSWSTTLDVTSVDLHRLTTWMSRPWAGLIPSAVPGFELVDATRHFRLQDGTFPGWEGSGGVDPARLGGWWPFLVCAMAAYGLLPRLGTLLMAGWRYRRAIDHAVGHLPGAQGVLDRLRRQLVETTAVEPEAAAGQAEWRASDSRPESRVASPYVLINWSAAVSDRDTWARWAAQHWGLPPERVLAAGGGHSLEEDEQTIEQAVHGRREEEVVVVLVKGWEPPLEECLDFLRALRERLGAGHGVAVVPVGLDAGGRPGVPSPEQVRQWRRGTGRLGDPWLSVQTPGETV